MVRLTGSLDMIIFVDWDVKPQIKQSNKFSCFSALSFIPPIAPTNFSIRAEKALCQKDELEYDAKATGVT